jgi:hypothetical protein
MPPAHLIIEEDHVRGLCDHLAIEGGGLLLHGREVSAQTSNRAHAPPSGTLCECRDECQPRKPPESFGALLSLEHAVKYCLQQMSKNSESPRQGSGSPEITSDLHCNFLL